MQERADGLRQIFSPSSMRNDTIKITVHCALYKSVQVPDDRDTLCKLTGLLAMAR